MTEVAVAFGDAVRDQRRTRGLSQEELARLAGVSVRAIRNLEQGRTARPHRTTARTLAVALGLPSPGAATRARCDLPAVSGLLGRADVLSSCASTLRERGVAVVAGGPGSGKTATATHLAHRLGAEYPDGQVYVDVEGCGDRLLTVLLRALGVEPPATEVERAAMVRAALRERRALVVLDNVSAEETVRPVLTGPHGSGVIVAARRALMAFGPVRLLDPLPTAVSRSMLDAEAGADRLSAEPKGTAALIRLCGGVPLALAVCGAWLAAHPWRSVADLAARLSDPSTRLHLMVAGDLSLPASVDLHLRTLGDHELAATRRTGSLADADLDLLHRACLLRPDLTLDPFVRLAANPRAAATARETP